MEPKAGDLPNKEADFNRKDNLAVIEQVFLGSSTEYKGEFFNSDNFLEKVARLGRVPEDMLTPVGLFKDPNKLEDIRKAREGRVSMVGMLNFLSGQVALFDEEGLTAGIEISQLDKSGRVIPSWKVFVVDKEGKIDGNRDNLLKLSLEPKFGEIVELSPNEETGELYLSIKPEFKPKDDI